jgi:hypothetical protein
MALAKNEIECDRKKLMSDSENNKKTARSNRLVSVNQDNLVKSEHQLVKKNQTEYKQQQQH